MKSKLTFFILVFLLLSSCAPKSVDNLIVISASTFEKKINAQDTFALYMSSPGCPYCQETKKNAIAYLKLHPALFLFMIDINDLSASSRQEFAQTVYVLIGEAFYVANGLFAQRLYVPTTIYYENGVATRAKIGVIEEGEYSEWLL